MFYSYALGLGRNDLPSPRLPHLTQDLTYRFPMDPGNHGIIYRVRASSDLVDWSQPVYDLSQPDSPQPVAGWISLPASTIQEPRRFLRLEVAKP